ncbi:MAG: helix-turn-helix domain-containing protein [Candidatus Tectomicrobia bacterium]|nr:helix-turn-helix domain-containing protein [Candidatus Tectomicrobia bacterium]
MTNATTETGVPSDRDAALADQAAEKLRKLTESGDGSEPVLARFGAGSCEPVHIPTPAVRLLKEILNHMARGNGVALTPLDTELTTRRAADLLQVSRTHLVQLLEDGRIPHRKVGAHRRVRARDLLDYRRNTEFRRHEALDELTAIDQKLGLQ